MHTHRSRDGEGCRMVALADVRRFVTGPIVVSLSMKAIGAVRGCLPVLLEPDDDAAVRTKPPADLVGIPITAIERPDGGGHHCTTGSVRGADDLLVVTGPTEKAERFPSGR